MMEVFIAIVAALLLVAWAFKTGKREGSRRGFGAGRYRRRRK